MVIGRIRTRSIKPCGGLQIEGTGLKYDQGDGSLSSTLFHQGGDFKAVLLEMRREEGSGGAHACCGNWKYLRVFTCLG